MFCIHKYSKWSQPFNTIDARKYGNFGDFHHVNVVMQSKVCCKCGKIKSIIIRDGKIDDEIIKEIK